MKKSFVKNGYLETTVVINKETGEILETEIKQHTYLANAKEDFFLVYSSILGIFNKMEQSEIRVFSFLLQYADGTKFSVDKSIRLEISKVTDLNERTIYNTLIKLSDKKLIFKHDSGAYQINPRYAYKGSTLDRNKELQVLFKLGCKDC